MMKQSGLETTAERGGMVGSGSESIRSKAVTVGLSEGVKQNNVTLEKDGRRPKGTHPNPTIAATISTMSLAGFTVRQVCETLKLSPETISEHYDDEMKHGRTRMMTDVVGSLAQRAIAGSDTAAIFLAKARLGWSDRQSVELTGKDGNPIEITHRAEVVSRLAGTLAHGITLDGEAEPIE